MNEPLISVIIPVYNMEFYLTRCLDSVLNNTYRNLEIICVDDGSSDHSLEILRGYEQKDRRMIVISQENGGVSCARNTALERMTGDYAAFIDPDDFVHPQYFALLLEALQKAGAEIACCGFRQVEDDDLPFEMEPFRYDPAEVEVFSATRFFQNHTLRSFCWCKLFPAEMLASVRFREDMKYSEDSVFNAEIWANKNEARAVALPYVTYYYYQHEGSLVTEAKMPDRIKAARIFAMKALQNDNCDQIFLDQAMKRCLSTRYYAVHIQPDREIARECGELLKPIRKRLKHTHVYGKKEKMIYAVFIRFPGLYWIYRSVTEPNMWKWEVVERKKRREARKTSQLS